MFDVMAHRHMGHGGLQVLKNLERNGWRDGSVSVVVAEVVSFLCHKVIVYAWHLIWKDEDVS